VTVPRSSLFSYREPLSLSGLLVIDVPPTLTAEPLNQLPVLLRFPSVAGSVDDPDLETGSGRIRNVPQDPDPDLGYCTLIRPSSCCSGTPGTPTWVTVP